MFADCVIIELNSEIKNIVISLRQNYKIKTPDAIIYASAKVLNAKLLTNNISDFEKIIDTVELVNP
ncbi:PIN domain-containing protein [Pedobacter lithocola]|uniref:PIN domain-containing protein n=1 Tax=Pedobacter lithocola TaxID=1908239 RepID=A0ABV8PE36_9SPHI